MLTNVRVNNYHRMTKHMQRAEEGSKEREDEKTLLSDTICHIDSHIHESMWSQCMVRRVSSVCLINACVC